MFVLGCKASGEDRSDDVESLKFVVKLRNGNWDIRVAEVLEINKNLWK